MADKDKITLEEYKKLDDDGEVNAEEGGILFTDEEALSEQRKVAWNLVKQIGSNIMEGKDLTRVSLPVRIFEPRSFLERVTDYWTYLPVYLPKAARETDPVARFKLVMAFAVAGLAHTCKQRKPFNPVLGETFEASYSDGTQLFLEQSMHHPPVTHFYTLGPQELFKFYGSINFSSSFRGNKVVGQQKGEHHVEFADGVKITWELPTVLIKGIMWGHRVCHYTGTMKFVDETNNLHCELQFNPDQPGFLRSMFSRAKKPPADTVRGDLLRVKPGSDASSKKSKNQHEKLATAEGSWIKHLCFDGEAEKVWDIASTPQHKIVVPDNALPSDSRHREDLRHLANEDFDQAQEMKVMIEEKQRHDRKLREEGRKHGYHLSLGGKAGSKGKSKLAHGRTASAPVASATAIAE
eukprot:TRINITY_DN679_c1_g1_i13.p1 TRINITY_DN679_c1_g1~~TRINITY_DN679_c1_g1_i13.p1  ORF type:complete len:408 (-),score=133.68 TRINITY_DN679_c1_g1_i13:373-1596(-)